MDKKIREMLGEEIESEFESLATLAPGSEEHTAAVNKIERLYKLKIEEERIEVERREKEEKQRFDNEQRRFNWVSLGVQSSLTLAGIIAYNVWFNRGLKFEETGTVTSPQVRNLMSKMLPKK